MSPLVHLVHHSTIPIVSPFSANHSSNNQQYISFGAHEVGADLGDGEYEYVTKTAM
jgi:hypothetical protein